MTKSVSFSISLRESESNSVYFVMHTFLLVFSGLFMNVKFRSLLMALLAILSNLCLSFVRTYVIHLLGPYVTILYNWLIF